MSGRRVSRGLLAGSALLLAGLAVAGTGESEVGRRLYEQGITARGSPLRATTGDGLALEGAQAACVACHRRSGMGSREGRVVVPPIAGPVLYARAEPMRPVRPGRVPNAVAPLRHEARPAYDEARVGQALRQGVDSEGRALDTMMPRYDIDDVDLAALGTYLRELGRGPVPGFEAGTLRLATVIAPDAEPHRADVVARAMQAWARSGALGGLPIDLQVWRLEGPASSWPPQLERWQREHAPFALLSGAGAAQWLPVRDHCEQHALPCLFPIVDLAPDELEDAYCLYFTRGVRFEARLLARLFSDAPQATRVVAWTEGDEAHAGHAAALELAGALRGVVPVEITKVDPDWQVAEAVRPGDVVVAWLSRETAARLVAQRPQALGGVPLILSARLAPPEELPLPAAWRPSLAWVSASSDPPRRHGKAALGLLPWMEHLQLPQRDEALLSEIYAATYFFGDALSRMRGPWSREWLIETLESSQFARPAGAAFVSLSLGPGQREAAKAGQLLRYPPEGSGPVAAGPRLVP